jgi:hypothetical protein
MHVLLSSCLQNQLVPWERWSRRGSMGLRLPLVMNYILSITHCIIVM